MGAEHLSRIHFTTYRGKTITLGGNEGVDFHYKFDGHTFGAFNGGHRDYIDFLVQFLLKKYKINFFFLLKGNSSYPSSF